MPAYFGEVANACALDRRMQHCSDMFGWKEKFLVRDMGNGKVRAAGIAVSMQGSGISGIDVGSVTVKLNDDGDTCCSSPRPTWARVATPSWPRWSPSIWNAPWRP